MSVRELLTAVRASPVRIVLSFAAIAFAALAGFVWSPQMAFVSARDLAPAGEKRFVAVKPQPFIWQIKLMGTIGPERTVPIAAPFNGVIREKHVDLGDSVKAGSLLITMDSAEVERDLREAESAFLKSAMAAEQIENWSTGLEVQRAKRSLSIAETTLQRLEQDIIAARRLLDKGIISRNEFDSLAQQRDSQRETVKSYEEDLTTTLDRGSENNLRLTRLELENTRGRLADLKQQMQSKMVLAPISGVLIRPAASIDPSQGQTSTETGTHVTRGQALFSIADTQSFSVAGAVDEVDVNKLRVGQTISIESDAFSSQKLNGKITSISAETGKEAFGRTPTFDVRGRFSIPDDTLRQVIRIGMSARITVDVYSNPAAIIVPISAVLDANTQPHVYVREGNGTAAKKVAVKLGPTSSDGIEIRSGLNPGDQIQTR